MSILRRFTDFLLQGRLQAMAIAFVCAYIPLIGSVSILITGLVTLRKGAIEGLYVLIAATFPAILSYFALQPSEASAVMGVIALVGISVNNVLIWLLAVLLRRFSNWNLLLEYSALLSVIIIGVVHILYPNVQDWWGIHLTAYFKALISDAQMSNNTAAMSPEVLLEIVASIKNYVTGLIIVSMLANAFLQLGLARWWQAIMFNPGGLRGELHHIRLSHVMGLLFIIVMGLSLGHFAVIADMMPVLYVVFCAAGLSFMHWLIFTKIKYGWVCLVLLYLLLAWFVPMSVVVISIIALLDTAINLRKRLYPKG